MPVVLVEKQGSIYRDRTGVEYEYPGGRYENWIQPGELFIYHAAGLGYTGAGVIGAIRPSVKPGLLVCEVLNYETFVAPVPVKNLRGHFFEATPGKGVYFAQGVRPVSDEVFAAITKTAEMTKSVMPGYASSATAAEVEEYSVAVAVRLMEERFQDSVRVMSHSNPGYDLEVGASGKSVRRYVEVKGTQLSRPVFFISEGERRFSLRHAGLYTLVVVTGIDLKAAVHRETWQRDGSLQGDDVELAVRQWQGELRATATTT